MCGVIYEVIRNVNEMIRTPSVHLHRQATKGRHSADFMQTSGLEPPASTPVGPLFPQMARYRLSPMRARPCFVATDATQPSHEAPS
jgi:hypothetical protein